MKGSFFKLPLIIAVCYWLMDSIIYFLLSFILSADNGMVLNDDLLDILVTSFLYGLPLILLVMFISAIALFYCRIHVLTAKNILFSVFIALILSVIMAMFYQGIFYLIWSPIFGDTYYSNRDPISLIYNISTNILTYLLIGFIVYYSIVLLHSRLGQSDQNHDYTSNKVPAKVHLVLFIILFMMMNLAIFYWLSLYFYDIQQLDFIIALVILVVILYFALKSSFSYEFDTIAISRLLKSAALSLLLSFAVSAVIGLVVVFIMMAVISNLVYDSYLQVLFIALLGAILQLIVACMIMRAVTRHYFSPTVMLTQQD